MITADFKPRKHQYYVCENIEIMTESDIYIKCNDWGYKGSKSELIQTLIKKCNYLFESSPGVEWVNIKNDDNDYWENIDGDFDKIKTEELNNDILADIESKILLIVTCAGREIKINLPDCTNPELLKAGNISSNGHLNSFCDTNTNSEKKIYGIEFDDKIESFELSAYIINNNQVSDIGQPLGEFYIDKLQKNKKLEPEILRSIWVNEDMINHFWEGDNIEENEKAFFEQKHYAVCVDILGDESITEYSLLGSLEALIKNPFLSHDHAKLCYERILKSENNDKLKKILEEKLKPAGFGRYADPDTGEVIAKMQDGKLVPVEKAE